MKINSQVENHINIDCDETLGSPPLTSITCNKADPKSVTPNNQNNNNNNNNTLTPSVEDSKNKNHPPPLNSPLPKVTDLTHRGHRPKVFSADQTLSCPYTIVSTFQVISLHTVIGYRIMKPEDLPTILEIQKEGYPYEPYRDPPSIFETTFKKFPAGLWVAVVLREIPENGKLEEEGKGAVDQLNVEELSLDQRNEVFKGSRSEEDHTSNEKGTEASGGGEKCDRKWNSYEEVEIIGYMNSFPKKLKTLPFHTEFLNQMNNDFLQEKEVYYVHDCVMLKKWRGLGIHKPFHTHIVEIALELGYDQIWALALNTKKISSERKHRFLQVTKAWPPGKYNWIVCRDLKLEYPERFFEPLVITKE